MISTQIPLNAKTLHSVKILMRKILKRYAVKLSPISFKLTARDIPALLHIRQSMDEDICPFKDKYRNELLIPQLLEIAFYGVDGVWVDGDCCCVKVGYHPDVIKAPAGSSSADTTPSILSV